jgi:hypothetical protein
MGVSLLWHHVLCVAYAFRCRGKHLFVTDPVDAVLVILAVSCLHGPQHYGVLHLNASADPVQAAYDFSVEIDALRLGRQLSVDPMVPCGHCGVDQQLPDPGLHFFWSLKVDR